MFQNIEHSKSNYMYFALGNVFNSVLHLLKFGLGESINSYQVIRLKSNIILIWNVLKGLMSWIILIFTCKEDVIKIEFCNFSQVIWAYKNHMEAFLEKEKKKKMSLNVCIRDKIDLSSLSYCNNIQFRHLSYALNPKQFTVKKNNILYCSSVQYSMSSKFIMQWLQS